MTKKAPASLGTRSMYKELVAAGVPLDHHESDLYVQDTNVARDILTRHGKKGVSFTSQIDGKRWLDVPFAYEPFWEKKNRRTHATKRDSAAELIANYGTWTSSYSNEDRDRIQGLANRLTAIDREEGRAAPPVGYSKERYAQAKQVVEDANNYGEKQQSLRAKRKR